MASAYIDKTDVAFSIPFENEPGRSNGFASDNVQEAIEEAKSAIEGKISVLPTFLNNGNTNNKWLALDGAMESSDALPAISIFSSKLAGISYVNDNDGSNIDIEFYKNGTAPGDLIFTWEVRNKRYAYKTNGLDSFTFGAGDRIACFARIVAGQNPASVIVNVFVQSTDSIIGEGGAATL